MRAMVSILLAMVFFLAMTSVSQAQASMGIPKEAEKLITEARGDLKNFRLNSALNKAIDAEDICRNAGIYCHDSVVIMRLAYNMAAIIQLGLHIQAMQNRDYPEALKHFSQAEISNAWRQKMSAEQKMRPVDLSIKTLENRAAELYKMSRDEQRQLLSRLPAIHNIRAFKKIRRAIYVFGNQPLTVERLAGQRRISDFFQ